MRQSHNSQPHHSIPSTKPHPEAASELASALATVYDKFRNFVEQGHKNSEVRWDLENESNQLGSYAGALLLAHQEQGRGKLFHDPECLAALKIVAQNEAELSDDEKLNIQIIWRELMLAKPLPAQLHALKVDAQCSLNSAWQRAKDQNDATLAMPAFQDIIDIRRLEVESRGFEGGDYETYLEFVEPEIPLQSLKDLIFPTSAQLFSYVPKAVALQQSHGPLLELPCIPSQTLNDIIVHVVSDLGFDLTRGTIEPSTTSCCVPISEGKVRLFYSEKTNFLDTILSAIHEAGHGMYDQGKGDNACPTNQLISMGLHESQARFWECMVGKSRGFMQYLHGVLLEHAPESTREITPDTLWRYANAVSPQELRIGSDDLTYNQHIVVRMIVEEALVSGELDAVNLPIRWNELYEQYLQLNPASDVVGVLQDLHWLDGHFGYFTSYALGNIFAAQLYWAMQGELGNQEFLVEQGNFKDIHQWLASNIYRNGCRLNSFDLIEKVTGAMPSGQLLVAHVVEALGL